MKFSFKYGKRISEYLVEPGQEISPRLVKKDDGSKRDDYEIRIDIGEDVAILEKNKNYYNRSKEIDDGNLMDVLFLKELSAEVAACEQDPEYSKEYLGRLTAVWNYLRGKVPNPPPAEPELMKRIGEMRYDQVKENKDNHVLESDKLQTKYAKISFKYDERISQYLFENGRERYSTHRIIIDDGSIPHDDELRIDIYKDAIELEKYKKIVSENKIFEDLFAEELYIETSVCEDPEYSKKDLGRLSVVCEWLSGSTQELPSTDPGLMTYLGGIRHKQLKKLKDEIGSSYFKLGV